MSDTPGHTVELAEGNRTLRELMREILDEEGFDCVDESASPADLLIVDVDSGFDESDARREAYENSDRPVLICGLADSKNDEDTGAWVDRPFNASDLIAGCRDALGLEGEPSSRPEEAPSTREVDYASPEIDDLEEIDDDIEEIEEVETIDAEGGGDETDASEILEIDDASSMVVDVQDLHDHFTNSGALSGGVEAQPLDVDELRDEGRDLEPVTGFLDEEPRTNPTVPDVPSGGGDDGDGLPEESSGIARAESTSGPSPGSADSTGAHHNPAGSSGPIDRDSGSPNKVPPEPSTGSEEPPSAPAATSAELPSADGGEPPGTPSSAPVTPELRRDLKELASLVATSWNRIGLTARWEDRAERLERTFEALIDGGISGASDELERVPPAHGFSGTIDVVSTFELIDVIRSRNLIGRLEISNDTGGFVLYFDGSRLVGIDDLEGRSESMLLDCLRQADSIADQVYEEMRRTVDDSLAAPLEMRLKSDGVVTDSQLLDARRTRAKWVLKEILGEQSGTFAFIHGNDESGQPWPVNELGLQVDLLTLELIREGAIECPVVEYTMKTTFVTVRERVEKIGDELLAPIEKDVLDYCIQPAAAREMMDVLEIPQREVRAAIDRLEAIGFLVKLGQQFTNVDEMFEFDAGDPNADSQMGPEQ